MGAFSYSVAIRTVGKGGDKYIKELESLHAQTIRPAHIYVFLAHGFTRPSVHVGMEEYVDTPKGLVHQRAAANRVEEDYVLIIDDDVYFPPDAVEQMYNALQENNADGVAPDTFPSQEMSYSNKVKAFVANGIKEHHDDRWAIKVLPSGAFTYNADPPKHGFLPTQSAAGTAVFMKTSVWRSIHYEDEEWIDEFPAGSFAEDQVMFYKMFVNGVKILMWYGSDCRHLDANTNKASAKSYEKLYYRAMSVYLSWHRTIYGAGLSPSSTRGLRSAFAARYRRGCFTRFVFSLMQGSFRFLKAYRKGIKDAKEYTAKEEYKTLAPFIIKKRDRQL